MKRLFLSALALLLLASNTLIYAAAAETVTKESDGSYSVTYAAGQQGTSYMLIGIEGDYAEGQTPVITAASVTVMEQQAAGDTGATFNFFPRKDGISTLYIFGGDLPSPVRIGQLTAVTGVQVTGRVLFQGQTSRATASLIYKSSGLTAAQVQTSTDGSYTFDNIEAGQYLLKITKPGYLSYTKSEITVGTSSVGLNDIDLRLIGGDINGNGQVNIEDLSACLGDYNKKVGTDTLNNANSDINGNGQVNIEDLSILLSGFNKKNIVE